MEKLQKHISILLLQVLSENINLDTTWNKSLSFQLKGKESVGYCDQIS